MAGLRILVGLRFAKAYVIIICFRLYRAQEGRGEKTDSAMWLGNGFSIYDCRSSFFDKTKTKTLKKGP